MNKETRQFIFGLILIVLCSNALLSFGLDLRDHLAVGATVAQFTWDLSMCLLEGAGVFIGFGYILKNI